MFPRYQEYLLQQRNLLTHSNLFTIYYTLFIISKPGLTLIASANCSPHDDVDTDTAEMPRF